MSLLLAGPNRITEWIEQSAFDAIRKGPDSVEYRAKLVQVLSRGGRGWALNNTNNDCCCPPYIVVHDGQTSTAAFLSKEAQVDIGMIHEAVNDDNTKNNRPEQEATKGCIVRISGWRVSTVQFCAESALHFSHLTQPPPNTTRFSSLNRLLSTPLCLVINKVETLGGQGMGLVGNAVDVNESIQVRRALQAIDYNYHTLCQKLKLNPHMQQVPVGDVERLDPSDFTRVLQQGAPLAPPQQENPVPVGNVTDLFRTSSAADESHGDESDPVSELLRLAEQQRQQQQTQSQELGNASNSSQGRHDDAANNRECDEANNNIGSVTDLLAHSREEQGGNPFDDVLALAEQERQKDAGEQRNEESADVTGKDDLVAAKERSFLSRLTNIFTSASRRLSTQDDGEKDALQPQKDKTRSLDKATPEKESDDEDPIVGISDMLVSQQDEEPLAPEEDDTEPLPVETVEEVMIHKRKRTLPKRMKPLKRHKASTDFFADLMRLGREGYTGVISIGGNTLDEQRRKLAGGKEIRSWLDCHVQTQ